MKKSKIMKMAAVLAALSMLGSMNVSASKIVLNDYQTMSESFDKTFSELISMSDDEFKSLDKYCGSCDEETNSFWAGYGFINQIKAATTITVNKEEIEEIIGRKIAVTEEDVKKAWDEYCDIQKSNSGKNFDQPARISSDQYIKSLGLKYSNAAETDFAQNVFAGQTDMTPVFDMQEQELADTDADDGQGEFVLKKIDKNDLAKKLKHYFGDTIKYQCYSLNNWQGNELGVRIVFDMPDKLEMTEDNLIYNAKILCCLSKICNSVTMEHAGINAYETAQKDIMSGKYDVITNDTVVDGAVAGDANGDNSINVNDCIFIAQNIAKGKGAELPDSADYNKDGKKNVLDASALARDIAENKLN